MAAATFGRCPLRYAFTSALATVGGTFLLVWIPLAFRREPASQPGLPWGGNTGWRIAGFAALAFLLLGLGPGFRF